MNYVGLSPVKKCFFLGITIAAILSITMNTEAEFIHPSAAPVVIFTGTFLPPDQIDEQNLTARTLEVVISENKTWIFDITGAENLAGGQTQQSILQNIYPRRLSFTGTDDMLKRLQKSDLAGKQIRLSGYLYKNARRFQVVALEILEEDT